MLEVLPASEARRTVSSPNDRKTGKGFKKRAFVNSEVGRELVLPSVDGLRHIQRVEFLALPHHIIRPQIRKINVEHTVLKLNN